MFYTQFTQARFFLQATRHLKSVGGVSSRFSIHTTAPSSALPRLNKVAIITGAARGIGRGIALQLAQDGYDVALNDLPARSAAAEDLRATIAENMDRKVVFLPGDVSIEENVERLVDAAAEQLGGVDVSLRSPEASAWMVANAGIALGLKSIMDTSVKDWDRILAVNARGVFLCYKYAAKQMIRQGRGGRIIGASSVAGKKGLPNLCSYSASKFAVTSLTQVAAQEWAKFGITVNAYAPGAIETDMMKETLAAVSDNPENAIQKTALVTSVLGFNGTPDDIAGLVAYLASEHARFITGQVITIDGGFIFQ